MYGLGQARDRECDLKAQALVREKKKTSIRLSSEAKALLEQLSKKLGISQSAVLEIAIRTFAKQEGGT